MKKSERFNNLISGLIAGLILPVIAFIILWLIIFDGTLAAYFHRFAEMNRLASLISLCAIPNLLLFFVFIWTNNYKSARGVIFATLILALAMVLIKYL